MKKKTLSVVVPCYNHANFIAETLNSILAENFDDFEVIVGDDASTDGSREVIRSFGDRVRPFFFNKNRGYFATVNDLFREVRGEYVHIFSSDDLYMPGFLATSMQLMLENNLKLTCSNIRYFSSDTEFRDTNLYPAESPVVFDKQNIIQVFRNSEFWVPGVSCITEVKTLKKYGLPNPKLENISDWFLFHQIALFEGIGYVPQLGIAMREQAGSYTAKVKKDRKRRNATYFAVLDLVTKDNDVRKRFRDSAILSFILDNLFWKLIFKPKWWDFFVCSKVSPSAKFAKSFKKRMLRRCN